MPPPRLPRWLAFCVLAVLVPAGVASASPALLGWHGVGGAISLVHGVRGGAAPRISFERGPVMSLSAAAKPVASTSAGVYVGSAWVEGAPGRRVCLRVREWAGPEVVGSLQSCAAASATWQAFPPLDYRARAGHSLDLVAFEPKPARGDSFAIDRMTLHAQEATASGLGLEALDSAHVRLDWDAVPGASTYRVSRGSLVLGTTTATTFTDALLWPRTSYDYTVEALDGNGQVAATLTGSATTAALPAAGFPRPFGGSFWNTPIGSDPKLDPNDAAVMAHFVAHLNYPNLTLRSWGVDVAEAHPGDPAYDVPCTMYSCTLGAFGTLRIPATAVPAPGGDHHLAVVDPATGREWDLWEAQRQGAGWTSAAGAAVSTSGDGIVESPKASGDAANFALLAGLLRPEEILQGHIDHALVITVPGIAAGPPVCPATHNAPTGTNDPNALREGMKLQLDPSVDVSALPIPDWEKTIARALQVYGAYVRDNGGTVAVMAENTDSRGYDAWAKVGLEGDVVSLAGIPWTKLRLLAPGC